MRKAIFLFSSLLLASVAWGQTPYEVSSANVTSFQVCNYPEAGFPCINQATIYKDSALTIPYSQPVAGFTGTLTFFITNGHTYRLQVNGSQARQYFIYGGAPATFTGGIVTGDTYFKSGVPWVDVKAYGAVCDGTTDDTTAIETATAAAEALMTSTSGGPILYVPHSSNFCIMSNWTFGTHSNQRLIVLLNNDVILSGTLTPTSNTSFIGQSGSQSAPSFPSAAMAVIATAAGNSSVLVDLNGAEQVSFDNIFLSQGQTTTNPVVHCHDNSGVGCVDIRFSNSYIRNQGGGDAIDFDPSSNGQVTGFGFYAVSTGFATVNSSHKLLNIKNFAQVHLLDCFGDFGNINIQNLGIASMSQFYFDNFYHEALTNQDFVTVSAGSGTPVSEITIRNPTIADIVGSSYMLKTNDVFSANFIVELPYTNSIPIIDPASSAILGMDCTGSGCATAATAIASTLYGGSTFHGDTGKPPQDNAQPYNGTYPTARIFQGTVDFVQLGGTPGNPASGKNREYFDSSNNWNCLTSAGAACNIKAGALTATSITDSGISSGTSPICPNGTGGAFTTSGCTSGGSGTVTSFSAGNLSPLFTTSVATATTTPALSFSLSNAAQNSVFAGPASGGAGAPSFQTAPTISAANMTSFPTFNQNTTGTAANLTGCTPSTAGSLCYWNGSAWTLLAGNSSGTNWLQETSAGVPSWTTPGGAGTVTSVTIAGTTNQVTASGTCTITSSGTCTLSLPNAVVLGTDNSAAGTLQTANGSANAHTIWGSGATTSNTIDGPTVAPTTGDLLDCTTSSTTCTLTDSGVLAANVTTNSSNYTTNGDLYATGNHTAASHAAPTNGQLCIGSTGNPCALATPTGGNGIAVTTGAGSITYNMIGVMGSGTAAATMTTSNHYFATNGGAMTPAAAPTAMYMVAPRAMTITSFYWNLSAAQASATTSITMGIYDGGSDLTGANCQITTNVTTTTTCTATGLTASVAAGDLIAIYDILGGGTGTSASINVGFTYQ